MSSIEYGNGYSPVEYDHKAFLLWGPLGRAFVPASLYEPDRSGTVAVDIAQGTLVDAGMMRHPDGSDHGVDRTVVVGDRAYAIGFDGVAQYDLTSLAFQSFGVFPDNGGGECCILID